MVCYQASVVLLLATVFCICSTTERKCNQTSEIKACLTAECKYYHCIPCFNCSKGWGIRPSCGEIVVAKGPKCVPCIPGRTYSPKGDMHSCLPCNKCHGKVELQPCNRTHNRMCASYCKKGFRFNEIAESCEPVFAVPTTSQTTELRTDSITTSIKSSLENDKNIHFVQSSTNMTTRNNSSLENDKNIQSVTVVVVVFVILLVVLIFVIGYILHMYTINRGLMMRLQNGGAAQRLFRLVNPQDVAEIEMRPLRPGSSDENDHESNGRCEERGYGTVVIDDEVEMRNHDESASVGKETQKDGVIPDDVMLADMSEDIRDLVCSMIETEKSAIKNWRHISEKYGISKDNMALIKKDASPGEACLRWIESIKPEETLNGFIGVLKELERNDIVDRIHTIYKRELTKREKQSCSTQT